MTSLGRNVHEITWIFAPSSWTDLLTIPQPKNVRNRRTIPRVFLNRNVVISTQAGGQMSKLFRARSLSQYSNIILRFCLGLCGV